jgi:hypothetical protein
MATEKRTLHESKYFSYEELAGSFGSEMLGMYVTEIYLATIQSPWDHFVFVRNNKPHENPIDSPYIKNYELVWTKKNGTIIPYGKNPDEYKKEPEAIITETNNHEGFSISTLQSDTYKKPKVCVKCGNDSFEYDSYWKEHTCNECGWISET